MANNRELKLRIHGKVNGKEITPLTLPMTRLVQYLEDFATLLGHRDYVHFTRVDEGSAAPIALIEPEHDMAVRERVRKAAVGTGSNDANSAYSKLNTKFIEDQGFGEITEQLGKREIKLIEFPGVKAHKISPVYGPIKEAASVQGELKRVGGQEPTIPVHVLDADGKWYFCYTGKNIAAQLGGLLFQQVRLHGVATWQRDERSVWQLLEFEIQSYDPPLATDDASSVIAGLRSVPGSEWNSLDDPLDELRRIRHGEDDVQ